MEHRIINKYIKYRPLYKQLLSQKFLTKEEEKQELLPKIHILQSSKIIWQEQHLGVPYTTDKSVEEFFLPFYDIKYKINSTTLRGSCTAKGFIDLVEQVKAEEHRDMSIDRDMFSLLMAGGYHVNFGNIDGVNQAIADFEELSGELDSIVMHPAMYVNFFGKLPASNFECEKSSPFASIYRNIKIYKSTTCYKNVIFCLPRPENLGLYIFKNDLTKVNEEECVSYFETELGMAVLEKDKYD